MTSSTCHPIFTHLRNQSNLFVNKLYGYVSDSEMSYAESPWVCKAVLQSLNELSQNYVLRLIFVESELSHNELESWYQGTDMSFHAACIKELLSFRILIPISAKVYQMNKFFQSSLKQNIIMHLEPWSDIEGNMNVVRFSHMNASILEDYSTTTWNNILLYVATSKKTIQLSPLVISLLLSTGIMTRQSTSASDLVISSMGYEFLLKDMYNQMWTFIYFKLQNMTPQNQTAAISMLLMLPYCIVGQSYSSSKLSPPQQDIMELLVLFGALYASSDHRDYFYPTSAAVNMIFKPTITHHTPTSVSSVSAPLTIIVETNFQVIAYISSELHVAMLMLLLDIGTIVRMPNMLLGVITRDSANIAFKKGINANQIVNFLQIHVHSKVLNATRKNATSKKPPVVPENVIDQLHIWEAQKNRINAQEAIFMDLTDFVYVDKLESTYQAFKAHVDSLGMCLYSDPTKHILAVTPEGFRQLQSLANIT